MLLINRTFVHLFENVMDQRKPDRKFKSGDRKPEIKPSSKEAGLMRLNRFIANSGVCSRRDADNLIRDGLISVNGKTVTEMGVKVSPGDDIRYKNKRLSAEKKVYILMNKPKGYVTTVEDPHADHTVLELISDACTERVYPVGRLDKATTGVLLLTNDGELTGKLTHPKYTRKKIYHVFLDKPVSRNDLFKLTEGVELDGELISADAVSFADPDDKTQIGIELHSGQNRVVRRIFEKLDYKVNKLDRVYFAGLTKKNLARGKWRFLTDKEINMLKRGLF
jgi:23S rRNA pseudouridine2605 synthase